MLPYPSGEPHIGHLKVYSVGDAIAHFHRRLGRACCTRWATTRSACRPRTTRSRPACTRASRPPSRSPPSSASSARWGISIDWSRELATHEPRYYRWTQWIFLELFRAGLAYRKEAAVKWCPNDQTVLANEQVDADGRCERCGALVEVRQLEQWFLRITDYAERLLGDLDTIDWPEHVKTMQRNWIGRSEGAEVTFRCEELGVDYPVFTTRPDTLFGATFFVMAPEHPDVMRLAAGHAQRAGGARVRQPRAERDQRGARQRREAQDRGAARAHRHQPRQRRADPDVRRRLRADGVRHRRDHGGARPRRARLRVRARVRPADPARDLRRRTHDDSVEAAPGDDGGVGGLPYIGDGTLVNSHPDFDGMRQPRGDRRDRRVARPRGQGPRVGQLPPARLARLQPALLGHARSRSSTASAAASCPCPRTSCRWSCPTSRTTRPRAARRSRPPRNG